MGAVEVHRLFEHNGWVGHEARAAQGVLRRRMEHKGVQDDKVPDLAGQLLEALALGDKLLKVEVAGRDALGVLGEELGDNAHGVRGDESAAALMSHVRPEDNRQKRLFARVQKMPEVATVFVPAAHARRRGLPGLICAPVEVGDKGI